MTAAAIPERVPPPQFTLSEAGVGAVRDADVIAVPLLPAAEGEGSPLLGPGARELEESLGLDLLALMESLGATGTPGEIHCVAVAGGQAALPELRLVAVVGVGAARPLDVRRAGAALGRAIRGRRAVATALAGLGPDALSAFVVGLTLGSFRFSIDGVPGDHEAEAPVHRVVLSDLRPDQDQAVLAEAVAIAYAGWWSRSLATVPSNIKNPAWLAEQAVEMAAERGLTCRVWDEAALAAEGFGGLLGVGQASATPPRLIRLDYAPPTADSTTPTVLLVGKGITFDSGGLSIKPREAMATMKRDMSGAAVVLATMATLARVGCPVRVVGLIAAAENAVDGNALRPGDVIRHYGGRTTEVTNTDAEGRLVMADALAYGAAELQPDAVVDVATLTGAVKVALGQQVGGLFSTDDALAATLVTAGEEAGEPLWRLPLHDGYQEKIASKVADADNGASGPGAILAALFLRPFVGEAPWAHLDLASVGDVPEDLHEWTEGPSGFGARLLLTWLGRPEPLAGVGESALELRANQTTP